MRAVPLSRYIVFLLIVGGGVAIDLTTKRLMFDWHGMPGGVTDWIWPGVLGVQTSLNEGALFGLGQGMAWFFSTLSVAAALGIGWYLFVVGAARQWVLTVALSGIMAGTLGNLYDRVGLAALTWRNGERVFAVRDWILVMFGSYHWPNFNIADSLLVSGALLLVWHAFFSGEQGTVNGQVALKS